MKESLTAATEVFVRAAKTWGLFCAERPRWSEHRTQYNTYRFIHTSTQSQLIMHCNAVEGEKNDATRKPDREADPKRNKQHSPTLLVSSAHVGAQRWHMRVRVCTRGVRVRCLWCVCVRLRMRVCICVAVAS